MASIHYEQTNIPVKEHKSVLETLLEAGVKVPNSCWAGVCHSCLMKMTTGTPPPSSQVGLSQEQLAKQLFLACQCYPTQDISVTLINRQQEQQQAIVSNITSLTPTIKELTLATLRPVRFQIGQYLTLWLGQTLARPYALAVDSEPTQLRFHIQRVVGGEFSRWVHDDAKPGDSLFISDLQGKDHLVETSSQQPILFIAAEAGLGSALLIAKEKLETGYRGNIRLIHWASNTQELYWKTVLTELANQFYQFSFQQVISLSVDGLIEVIEQTPQLKHQNIYLTGFASMIKLASQHLMKGSHPDSQIQMMPFISHEPQPL
ncbi:2Fe-2S iron-sulfur cluster binding domain-containing protein [Endozoicomonas sp. SM1973]|uniref:2Fe-2S iron-sulfur cluster binding domain-containing protein n=1 Tax=Spartinivicinus marinus TaxID=2994442 RepID=A0A853I926_9GAMM|nr:2Fe-2S iron-sulfur cluster-binding protein [Spartinivicinus marinus]MCX4025762.1 2Fe-2S iron-sulfur cluster-binding protein [Spartinivicinus marinus]NYZ65755.1 2Fe-2S iron-sulfur cluster binding domain-containing protein [Spartinivicinus marinus]